MFQSINKTVAGFFLLMGAGLIWGSSFAIGKLAVDELGAIPTTVLRFLLASLVFITIILWKGWVPKKADLPLMLSIAFFTVPGTFLLQFYGLSMTSASHAAIMIGMEPIIITFMSWLFLRDRIQRKDIAAAILAFVGVIVVAWTGSANTSWLGDAMVLLSTISVAIWVLLSKKMMGKYNPLFFTAYITIFGTLMLIPFLWVMPDNLFSLTRHASHQAWLSVVFLALFCTILAGLMWNFGLKIYPAHQASVFLSLEPLAGVILGIALLNEPFSVKIFIGCVLIIAATVLATLKPKVEEAVS